MARAGVDEGYVDGRLAGQLVAFVLVEALFQGAYLVGRDAAQSGLVAADGRGLGVNGFNAAVGGPEAQGVTTGVTKSLDADTLFVDFSACAEVGDRPSPVRDLLVRVDVLATCAAAVCVVVSQPLRSQ